jgi:hypothetical protein
MALQTGKRYMQQIARPFRPNRESLLMTETDAMLTKAAGIAGAMLSFKFLKGTLPERLVMACGGAMLSYYGTTYASAKTGLPEGLCGFLVGLFGMAICARIYEAIREVDFAELVRGFFKRG